MYILNFYLPTRPTRIIGSLLLSFILSSPAIALKTDIEQPVKIDADSVMFNKSKGLAVYEGSVSISQGTLEIKASKIEITAPNNEIAKITANGSPVIFKQKMDDGKIAKGTANLIQYQVKEKRLVMDGSASLSQGADTFSSNHIEYAINTGELKAGKTSKTSKAGRVKAIFYPSNKAK